jgi:hypothetical protein
MNLMLNLKPDLHPNLKRRRAPGASSPAENQGKLIRSSIGDTKQQRLSDSARSYQERIGT